MTLPIPANRISPAAKTLRRSVLIASAALMMLFSVSSLWASGRLNSRAKSTQETDRAKASGSKSMQPIPVVRYARQLAAQLDLKDPKVHQIDLWRNGAHGNTLAVTMGIPFPPGKLRNPGRVQIIDTDGTVLPAHVEPTLLWRTPNGGIRAVQVQFHVKMDGDHKILHFRLGHAGRTDQVKGWPYSKGLVKDSNGVEVPGVLATLSPIWMSASMIAGPQWPALHPEAYDRYFAIQYGWAKKLPRNRRAAWLFDRPTTLFQQYVRTGRKDYLASAMESYRFYIVRIKRTGMPGWPECSGGWEMKGDRLCDPKYVYIQPIKFALGLAGDAGVPDYRMLIRRMVGEWDSGGWNPPEGPYLNPKQWYTERESGLGLLEVTSAWEITGNPAYREDVLKRVGWLYQQQRHNPDGLGDDGSWRNSWQVHEGNKYNPATDVRGTSPWMSENIIDGLWHAWLATGDKRIPGMVVDFARYLERYGWIDISKMPPHTDWRRPCSGPNGQISWYWSSAHASFKQLAKIESSDGWYSDAHNVELRLPVAAGRFFTTDPKLKKRLTRRLELLQSSLRPACAANSSTPRRFNWNNRGVGVVQWFIHEFKTGQDNARAHAAAAP